MIALLDKLKKYRKYVLLFCDFIIWNMSFYISYAIDRSSFSILDGKAMFMKHLLIVNVCFAVVFVLFKLYDKIWRYADIEDFFYAGIAIFSANSFAVSLVIPFSKI